MRSAPDTLAGLPLHHVFTGPRALAAIQRLHGTGAVRLEHAWVAGYGDERASGMLYVGVAPDAERARGLMEDMERRVAGGPTPFHDLRQLAVAGREIGLLRGQGQLHFLYTRGSRVVWASIDADRACAALKQLLGRAPVDTAGRCELPGPG